MNNTQQCMNSASCPIKLKCMKKKKRGRKRKTHESKHIQLNLKVGPAQQNLGLKAKILYKAFLYVNIN